MPRGKVLLGLGGMRPSSVVLAGGWTHIWVRKPWQRLPAWQKQSRGTETRAGIWGTPRCPLRAGRTRAEPRSSAAQHLPVIALSVQGGRCWAGITRCRGRMVPGRDTQEPADPGAEGCQGTRSELGSPRRQQVPGPRDAVQPERAGVTCLPWAEGRGSPAGVPGVGAAE